MGRASELRIFSALSQHHQLKMSAIARLSVSPRLAMAWMRPASAQATSLLHTSSAKQDIDSAAQFHRSWSRHRRSRWIRSWYRICVRIPHHRLRQEPFPQAAAFLLRYPWICPVRGHGSVLFDDGLPSPVRFLSDTIHLIYTGGVVLNMNKPVKS